MKSEKSVRNQCSFARKERERDRKQEGERGNEERRQQHHTRSISAAECNFRSFRLFGGWKKAKKPSYHLRTRRRAHFPLNFPGSLLHRCQHGVSRCAFRFAILGHVPRTCSVAANIVRSHTGHTAIHEAQRHPFSNEW